MSKSIHNDLSRRERQIMQIIYARGDATVADIVADLPDPPSDTAVRTLLRILEQKGQVKRRKSGRKHVYRAAKSRTRAAREAMRSVIGVFFGNSVSAALASHLADPSVRLTDEEIQRLRKLIAQARREGK